MINLLTILIALAKIGSIYAKARRDKQAFQALVVILIMIVIIKNQEQKKQTYYAKYRRSDEF